MDAGEFAVARVVGLCSPCVSSELKGFDGDLESVIPLTLVS